jgi:acyl-CoA thioesterase
MLAMIPCVTKKWLHETEFGGSVLCASLQAAKKTADKSKTILNNIERWQKVCG